MRFEDIAFITCGFPFASERATFNYHRWRRRQAWPGNEFFYAATWRRADHCRPFVQGTAGAFRVTRSLGLLVKVANTLVAAALCLPAAFAQSAAGAAQTGTIRVDAKRIINSFDPDAALGSSIDVLSRIDINSVFTPHILQESLSAGWGPITYRNNTELRMAAWHWNESSSWSDAAHKSGYFTGSTELKEPIRYILAYALPHRGFATSGDRPVQGPNLTYWKSNPYLTSKFTGESDTLHPQWVVVDLKAEKRVSAVRIQWENPYAIAYEVEYWTGADALDFDEGPPRAMARLSARRDQRRAWR